MPGFKITGTKLAEDIATCVRHMGQPDLSELQFLVAIGSQAWEYTDQMLLGIPVRAVSGKIDGRSVALTEVIEGRETASPFARSWDYFGFEDEWQ